MSESLIGNKKKDNAQVTPEYMDRINSLKRRVRYEYIRICRSRKRKKAEEAKVCVMLCFVSF